MAVSPGDEILAAQFNSLRNRTASLLGTGVADFGYGQHVLTDEISAGTTITSDGMRSLRNDINRIYKHQVGSEVPLDPIFTGDIIGADQSGTGLTFDNQNDYTFDNSNTTKGFNDYGNILNSLEVNRFDIAAAEQEETVAIVTDTRTVQWSHPIGVGETPITSEIVVSFESSDDKRYFLNTGGQLRFSGIVSNVGNPGDPSYQRNINWQSMIDNPGEVQFGYNYIRIVETTASNAFFPQTLNFGIYNLTTSYQEIFTNTTSTGDFAGSYWTIFAKKDDEKTLRFRVKLVDDGVLSAPEPVTADVTLNYGARRAIGPTDSAGNPIGASITRVNVDYPEIVIVKQFQ